MLRGSVTGFLNSGELRLFGTPFDIKNAPRLLDSIPYNLTNGVYFHDPGASLYLLAIGLRLFDDIHYPYEKRPFASDFFRFSKGKSGAAYHIACDFRQGMGTAHRHHIPQLLGELLGV